MDYKVRVVREGDLPADVDWVYVRQGERLTFVLKSTAMRSTDALEAALERAWVGYRGISEDRLLAYPPAAAVVAV